MRSRESYFWAALFAVPVGVGVAGAVAVRSGGDSPLSVGAGLLAAAVLFAFVHVASRTGEADDAEGGLQVGATTGEPEGGRDDENGDEGEDGEGVPEGHGN